MSLPIAHINNEQRRGFFIEQEGKAVAEMGYSRVNDKLVIVEHTLVDDSLAGQGVARRLLNALVAWARESGTQVLATCPYVMAQFNKDASIADVRGQGWGQRVPSFASPASSSSPSHWMQRSLALAASAVGITNPNPAVGCVIVSADGQSVLGEGHTQPVGGPHAEVMALRDAAAQGTSVAGATAYVTLEPCAHYGRTPPCCDGLVAAGIGRVVAALTDPNPQVAGQGFARLQAAGIAVEIGDGAAQARQLNLGFLQRMEIGRPWLRAKVAASMDGYTALPDGQSQWITGPEARVDGQRWRARADLVLTGIGTVLADDPQLNVRDLGRAGTGLPQRQPHLAIVDSQLRTPLLAKLWQVPGRQVWIVAQALADGDDSAWAQVQRSKQHALEAQGAQVLRVPLMHSAAHAGLDLQAAIRALSAAMPLNEIHAEAGAGLNAGLLQAGLVDEWLLYLAPAMLGQGRGMASLPTPLASLEQAPRYAWLEPRLVGVDLCVRALRQAQ